MLRDAVRSVLDGSRVPDEIVVVDQSARADESLGGWDGGCEIRQVRSSESGLSRARNLGFEIARHEMVAIVDDDMVVTATWLTELVAGRRERSDIVTGRVLRAPAEVGRVPVPDAALVTSDRACVHRGVGARDPVPGAGLLLPRSAVLAVGGYDERMGAGTAFGGGEDNDLGLRLLESGAPVRHVPDAVALHRGRPSESSRWATEWAYGTGKAAFFGKHVGRRDVRRRLAVHMGRRLLRAPVRAVRDLEGGCRDVVHVAALVFGLVRWFASGTHRRPTR